MKKVNEIIKIILLFILVQVTVYIVIPFLFIKTSGISGAIAQQNVMSNLGQCFIFCIAWKFIKEQEHERENQKLKVTEILALGIIGIILAVINNVFMDGANLVMIGLTDNSELIATYGDITIYGVISALVTYAVIPSVCEEMFYRKLFCSRLEKCISRNILLILNGVLFGIAHMSIEKFIPMFLLGVFLTNVYMSNHKIVLCIVLHFLYNVIDVLIQCIWPLPTNSCFISENFASADETILYGIRCCSFALIIWGILLFIYYFRKNKMLKS